VAQPLTQGQLPHGLQLPPPTPHETQPPHKRQIKVKIPTLLHLIQIPMLLYQMHPRLMERHLTPYHLQEEMDNKKQYLW
jgi:hypothetical protein